MLVYKSYAYENRSNCVWKIDLLNNNSISYVFTEKYLQ